MKNQIKLILAFLLVNLQVFSQYNLSSKEAKEIKSKSLIVVLPEQDSLSSMLKKSFESKWTFQSSISFVTEIEAIDLMNSTPGKYIKIILSTEVASKITKMEQYYGPDLVISKSTLGEIPKLYIYKDNKVPIHAIGLPSNAVMSEITLMETIQRLIFTINEIEKSGSFVKTFGETKTKYINELKIRKLLIPKEILENENVLSEIKEFYKYDIEVVDQSEIDKLILAGSKEYAYMIIVEEIVNVHIQYVCNTDDSKILAHYHSMVQSGKTYEGGVKNLYLETKGFKKMVKELN